MPRFHAYTRRARPGLHVWRRGTPLKLYLAPAVETGPGWVEFAYDLEPGPVEAVRFMLFEFDRDDRQAGYEDDAHQRELSPGDDGQFPQAVWFAEGAARVLLSDPRAAAADALRVQLISQTRFRPGRLYLWDAATGASRRVEQAGENAAGPYFDLSLHGPERSFFNFKFIRRGEGGGFDEFEGESANRLWCATDGGSVWAHSGTAEVATAEPRRATLRIHYRQELDSPARMRVWAENGDYQADALPGATADGWTAFEAQVYTRLPYGVQFWNPGLPDGRRWESDEAKREHIRTGTDAEFWTLEGDRALFATRPNPDRPVELVVAAVGPGSPPGGPLTAHVWVNRARAPLASVPVGADGRVAFQTYPDVVTSIKFRDGDGRWEAVERHTLRAPAAGELGPRFVVLGRPPLLGSRPPADLFADPPFPIRRPGAYEEGGFLHLVVHAPDAARARLIGEWTGWLANPVEMRSTRDGTYWWARAPVGDVLTGLGGAADYHGARYQFLFDDDRRLQDPAAGWVESSWNEGSSRLVRSDRFAWTDRDWRRPGWESLVVYQLHPSRFTNRFGSDPPLRRVAREIEDDGGYLRDLGVTAIQLMPVNEVGTHNSWGYDPAFFYAVENSYCGDEGPDALKALVDACHRHGLAVLLDVVFNHAGTVDNILWQVARDSFFDGDTQWGAMVNFDHPQCRHFFAQNLAYLAREYHIDGFRLDHTATIVHSAAWDGWSGYVRRLGSGGGWDFLHAVRAAARGAGGDRCILTAEHLPNEWGLTNSGGPMDSQWCDDFHDRMVDACRRQFGMSRLADAFQLSHAACDDWYKVVNYPESHDEVGNVRDRVCFVAGWGQGLRMSKVAAAGTLLARGIPMFFMGAESAEDEQFTFGGTSTLDLDGYLADPDRRRVRAWWRELCRLHRDPNIQGPSPLDVRFADGQLLAFARGGGADFFVLLNFGGWSGGHGLDHLNLPGGVYRELWNSTWPAFAVAGEGENEHTNGGRDARLRRSDWLRVPDYGAVILERVG